MKKIILALVLSVSMSAISFAGEKTTCDKLETKTAATYTMGETYLFIYSDAVFACGTPDLSKIGMITDYTSLNVGECALTKDGQVKIICK